MSDTHELLWFKWENYIQPAQFDALTAIIDLNDHCPWLAPWTSPLLQFPGFIHHLVSRPYQYFVSLEYIVTLASESLDEVVDVK